MKFMYNCCLAVLLLSSFNLLATNITFQVDMGSTSPSADGVSVAYAPPTVSGLGDITIISLDDADGDGIYVGTSDVPHDTIGYFFINGMASNPLNFEMVPEDCGISVSLLGLTAVIRPYILAGEATLPAVCFSSCEMCALTDCNDPLVLISDDASEYELGDLGMNAPWGLWPGASIGVIIDTLDGDNVFSIVGNPAAQDVMLLTGDLTSGHYLLSWNQYIPAGNGAYFNVQHQVPDGAGYWAVEVDFIGDGVGVLLLSDDAATQIPFEYPEDEFFYVALIIDIDNDEARLIVDEYTVGAWKFSDGFTNGGVELDLMQLSGINFYPLAANYIWYFDDVMVAEIPAAGAEQYCYTATTIEPGTHTVSDLSCFGGGMHHDDGAGLGAQWFQYTPTEDGWISISSCEGGADSRGWILTGDCHSLDIVGVNDDQCALEPGSGSLWASYREATVVGGQTYYIMWDNVWDDLGFDFELTFNTSDLVVGDFCESALDIQPGSYDILEFTGNAAVAGPIIDNTSQGRSPTPYAMTEWYQYTPDADGFMTITSCEGSASDNRVWLYTGECGTLSSLTQVATSDDDCETGFASMITDFPMIGGTTYYIEWDNGWSSDAFTWDLIVNIPQTSVTFQVDMNLEGASPDGVFVAGSFSNFDNVAMEDSDADGVYTATVSINSGSNVEYKFKNGPDGWENIDTSFGDNCATGEFGNRVLAVGTEDTTLDPVCFAYCVACDLVAVDELTFAQSVKLFPNPTDGQLQLNVNLPETIRSLNVRVVNLLGSTVLERSLGTASQYQETLDLSTLPAGTYLLQLTSGELQLNRKVVVK